MIKFRVYYDKDEETKGLNELCAQGWALQSFFAGFYSFEKCKPGQYIYQIDLGEKFGKVSDDYRELMKDMNVEIVQNWGYWVILRKETENEEFELYTDVESKKEHYIKILKMFKIATIIEIIAFFIECIAGFAGEVSFAYVAAIIILIMIIVFINAINKTKNMIYKLEEQRTGIAPEKRREVSPLLTVGLLFNCCALTMKESVSEYLSMAVSLVAIIFMCAGLWDIFKNKRK